MRTIKTIIKVYTFDELSEDSKEVAINNERENTLDYDWWDWIIEDLIEQSNKYGVEFVSDDVSFELDRGANICIYSENLRFKWESHVDLPIKFGAYQNYLGGGMSTAILSEQITVDRVEEEEGEDAGDIIEKLSEVQSIFENTLEKLHKEYQDIQSDDYLIESIKEKDLEFLENGESY